MQFIGFVVIPGPNVAFFIRSDEGTGVGNEVAYNEIIGQYVATTDNHDGIVIENSDGIWVHSNNIYGVTGDSHNSSGIKVYKSTNLIVEDNYIHGNTAGIFDKDGGYSPGNSNTYRRNWITNSSDYDFVGNNQGSQALYYIYDNVVDGIIHLYTLNTGSQIYNNLLRSSEVGNNGLIDGIASWLSSYQENIWNNVVISGGQPVWGYSVAVPFTPSGSMGH